MYGPQGIPLLLPRGGAVLHEPYFSRHLLSLKSLLVIWGLKRLVDAPAYLPVFVAHRVSVTGCVEILNSHVSKHQTCVTT